MRLQAYRLQNYRRLRDVVIELDDKISIFVGANNSGKTSAVQGLFSLLRGDAKRFELFDFSAALWPGIDEAGEPIPDEGGEQKSLPSISLDMWFRVGEQDLVAAMPLLPSTDWDGKCVGVRVAFEPKNQDELFHRFRDLRGKGNEAAKALAEKAAKAEGAAGAVGTDFSDYKPWPESLTKYLTKALATEYTFRYYVLDEREFEGYREKNVDYSPLSIAGDKDRGGAAVIKSLLKVDFLRAQRHLDDPDEGTSSRSENLSRKLSRFYQRHLEKRGDDHQALQALDASEKGLNFHLQEVFKDTLDRLKKLGYPGVNNPDIVIRAALEPSTVLGQDAKVHYVVPGNVPAHLPDSYNGLGFKNLVYMVVELLDLHERWNRDEAERAPLHLVFIEEPEAHLHAQIQQVFIRNVLKLLEEDKEDQDSFFHTQLVVTTHSPHILYERGFSPIRYFRRVSAELEHHTDVRNLSRFKAGDTEKEAREFLQRYLKLTHCDLFFSDAAVLVEGNVERLLMPAMIETAAPRLRSSALTILEVGGAFAHRFQELIEFVGLTTLVVTDLDSVEVKEDAAADVGVDEDEDELRPFEVEEDGEGDGGEKATSKKRGSTCHAHVPHAVTANQTLISWLPKKHSVDELWKAPPEQKVLALASATDAHVRVAYQTPIPVTVEGNTVERCGRTLEEAFGLENAAWCQAAANRPIGLKLRKAATTPEELALGLHKRVVSRSFDKTRFALEVLASGPLNQWRVPTYISEGLVWLEKRVAHEQEAEVAIAAGAAAIEPVNDGAFLVEAGAAQ
ncbi:ATP-dependent endonuclease [Bordetella sp. N]|uniref:AAA family ATPase n=1 Tax=Bordetella sp. N TaxID=1746199 RepID=UPI000709224F|nr:ATP-dependent endonuclease [Bordetella sp. N]ALM81835.1 ATP-dependent endonuclease [Bordetella sp. N]